MLLCAAMGTNVSIAFNKRIGAGFFGGEGFILQKLKGNGLAFLHAGGTVVKKELKNQTILIDTGCIVAFSSNLEYSIERAGNLKSMIFVERPVFSHHKRNRYLYLQSLPFLEWQIELHKMLLKLEENLKEKGLCWVV